MTKNNEKETSFGSTHHTAKNVITKIGKLFLNLILKKHFPPYHKFH